MPTIITKRHDTDIVFTDTPSIDGVTVPPASLTGATLRFLLKADDPTVKPPIVHVATINPDGTFSYSPVAGDVDTATKYRQEWEVTFPNSKILTFPNNGYNVVKIIEDLGP